MSLFERAKQRLLHQEPDLHMKLSIQPPYQNQIPYEVIKTPLANGQMGILMDAGDIAIASLNIVDDIEQTPDHRLVKIGDASIVLQRDVLINYSGITSAALASLDFTDQHVLDAGAGDGIMDVIVAQQGASAVTAIDCIDTKKQIRSTLATNGVPRFDLHFLHQDLSEPERIARRIDAKGINVVVANLGPSYGNTHLAVVDLLPHLPNCAVFVGGGYAQGHPELDDHEARIALAQHGFTRNYREFTFTNRPYSEKTFIIERE